MINDAQGWKKRRRKIKWLTCSKFTRISPSLQEFESRRIFIKFDLSSEPGQKHWSLNIRQISPNPKYGDIWLAAG